MKKCKRIFILFLGGGLQAVLCAGPLLAADMVTYQEFKVKWLRETAEAAEREGRVSIEDRRWKTEWDQNQDLFIDSSEAGPMLAFAEAWRIHKLQLVVDSIDGGAEKAHITRKRFLRQWDTNKDWYIDRSEVEPVREELAKALAAQEQKKNYTYERHEL